MLLKQINKKRILIFLLFSFFLLSCANQLPPPGGDPDKIPPTIVEFYPPNGTTNYNEDYFEVVFSEYVDKRSATEAIFISPFIEGALEYTWTGTTLEVTFPEDLKVDVTYTITVGTDVVDLNNKNRMAESFMFSFSTGNKIDTKIISGKVYGKQIEGIFIYAYKFEEDADTLLKRKPDYISQTGVEGNFKLQGLGFGKYRVFAVSDNFKDYLYQQDQDEIGIPQEDIYLAEEDSLLAGLRLLLFNADITKPRLISGVMTDKYHLLVSTSKPVDPKSIKANNFSLFDSTQNKAIEIEYALKGNSKPEEFILMFDEQINIDDNVYLFADTLIDLLRNKISNDFTQVVISDRVDTSSANIFATEPNENGLVDFENTEIKIFFDEAVDKDFTISAVALTDTFNNPVSFDIDFYDDATLIIKPTEKLKPDKDYLVKIDLNQFKDIAGNNTDSTFVLKFSTISGLEFTGVSGKVIDINYSKSPILVLENTEVSEYIYEEKLTSENFVFNRVEPGKYLLWCFLDENRDGKYNYGYPQPIEYSEEFSFYPDTLNLRPRWEVSDLIFRFK